VERNAYFIDQVFEKEKFLNLVNVFDNPKSFQYEPFFSRYIANDGGAPELRKYFEDLVPLAKNIFGSKTLLPTYAMFAHYEGNNPSPSLFKHKDDNACTYTIDMCLYQKYPWDLYVEDRPYTLYPNQAVAYYGNDQEHWREDFPNPEENYVAMIFFHFAEPDHWWFVHGPDYLHTHIRNSR
jgi:hypothetical protein